MPGKGVRSKEFVAPAPVGQAHRLNGSFLLMTYRSSLASQCHDATFRRLTTEPQRTLSEPGRVGPVDLQAPPTSRRRVTTCCSLSPMTGHLRSPSTFGCTTPSSCRIVTLIANQSNRHQGTEPRKPMRGSFDLVKERLRLEAWGLLTPNPGLLLASSVSSVPLC